MSLRSKLGRLAATLCSESVRAELAPPSLETLEPRVLMAANPVVGYIPPQTVLSGSPLYIPLKGSDADGNPISWTVTSSNTGVLSTYVPARNRSLRVQMGARGAMTFELFEDKAPRATARIIQLANSGFYDGLTFHRIINNFMIQGGDPEGDGTGGSDLPDFDDQFHPDLQHNRAGLLSLAKSGDDTNNSQFFITDTSTNYPRWLDYNHTIFGVQTTGETLRDAISNTAVDGNDKPTTPQVMTDVSVFTDTANGVAMLKVPANVTSGTVMVTVRARDSTGRVAFRRFNVTVQPDTHDSWPYLDPIRTVRTERNTPVSFRLTGVDADGGNIFFDGLDNDTVEFTVAVNNTNGLVTVTPPTGFTGELDVLVAVRKDPATQTDLDIWDRQIVTVQVVAPVAADAWDAGVGDDSAGRARFIGLNYWQLNRTIDTGTDGDWVRFTLADRSRVIIRAGGADGGDVRLLLRGPNRVNVVPSAPDSAIAAEGATQTAIVRTGARMLNAGTYWVRVDGLGMVVPNYALRVEARAMPASAPLAADTGEARLAAALWDQARRSAADDAPAREADEADSLLEIEPILAFLA